MLEEEVFVFAEKKLAVRRTSDEHHSRMERVLYDERVAQNQLENQGGACVVVFQENSNGDFEMETDQIHQEYEFLAKDFSVNDLVRQMNLEQDQKYLEDVKASQQNTADISDTIEGDMCMFGTPPEFKRYQENSKELFDTLMEEENDEDDEVEGGMKKLDLHVFGQKNVSPKIVQNEEVIFEQQQQAELGEQQEHYCEQEQQDQQGDDGNNSEQKQQLDLYCQENYNEQIAIFNQELQKEQNNQCSSDSNELELPQRISKSKNASPSDSAPLDAIPTIARQETNNEQFKDEIPTNIENLVANDLFSQVDCSKSKSKEGSIPENPSISQAENEAQLQETSKEGQKEDQQSQDKQQKQIEQLPIPQENEPQIEQKREKPKIDVSLHTDPCFSNPPSPIKNSALPAEEQHEIFQENPCNPDDLFPDEQLFYHPNSQPQQTSLPAPSRQPADEYESQDIDYQLSQQLFQDDNNQNQENQFQDEEIFSYDDQPNPANPQCSSGSDNKNNNDFTRTTSQIHAYQDYQQQPSESFGLFGITFDNKEYDQLMEQQIEEDIVNISAEEKEFNAFEVYNTKKRVKENREAHEFSMDSRRKFLNLFRKATQAKVPHKPNIQKPYRARRQQFKPTEIYRARGVGSLQESRLMDDKKGRMLVQRRGFQKTSNQEYQFDSDRENGVESGDENKIKLKYLIKLQFIESMEQKTVDLLMLSSTGTVCLLRNFHQLPEIQSLKEVSSTDGMESEQMRIYNWQNRCEILKIEGVVQDMVFSQKLSKLVCKCSNVTLKVYSLILSNHMSNPQESQMDKPMEVQEKTTFQLLGVIDISFMYMCLIETHSAVGIFQKDMPLKYIHLDSFGAVQPFEIDSRDPNIKHSHVTSQKNIFPFFVYNAENNLLLVSSSETAFVFYEVTSKQQTESQEQGEQQTLLPSSNLVLQIKYQLECNTIGTIKCLTFMTGTGVCDSQNPNGIIPPKLLTGGSMQILGMWDCESRNLKAVTQLPLLPLQVMQSEQIIIRDQFNIITIESNDLVATREYAISKKKGVSTIASDLCRSMNIVAVATNDKQIVLVQLEETEEKYVQQF